MSRTYRNTNNKPNWANSYFTIWHGEESKEWHNAMFHRDGRDWFMSTPGWWVHDMMTVKERAITRMAIQRVYKLIDYDDYVEFPLHKKPHNYYW